MNAMTNNASLTLIQSNTAIVGRSLKALKADLKNENALLLTQTFAGRVQRVLKIYKGVKPVLTVLSTLPLLPTTWRAGVVMLIEAMDAIANSSPEVGSDFKAGKDL